ncbi:UDP-2,4-diacetamido-2,4,6-trideoxy-beta-L-altropyranose hydrolase [Franzmannia qiaohouensis]|uniref:UDP-2,4-diacetamido-2,4, 6-trideoxy-beta-L-altropyranose hydrolase n=1 Tax=Franzmannia qiaohouensis TaxID=1329370 RepID=A0ABU1HJ52_9GAMM|nr:UDP-2,4-diacetamido-2,4,6-trideoxy-beta-L-altropyranose hydrolase [Halomonas qiaohouensis]MDR5907505.1 UDP-2,4-diacetamido-2,4,6-trideoxy-beta-L-altropyranose hydrolase [Halomonas qiaohouensis]
MTAIVDPMSVVFRVDASIDIGTGHVMRCLTLADALSSKGVDCHFVSRELHGNLIEQTRLRGYTVHVLPAPCDKTYLAQEPPYASWLGVDWLTDAAESSSVLRDLNPEWLVLDHYALDGRWEEATRQHWQRLFVIDDLADRTHIADLLLDQNLGRQVSDYKSLLPEHAHCLVGPQYALLRPEFAELRPYSLMRREAGALRHLLISLGGVDKDNATGTVLRTLQDCPLPEDCTITVVMGGHAPHLDDVQAAAATMTWPTEVVINVSDMAKRMAEADLAIGAAGSSSWERCCLGLPTLLLILAENQKQIAHAMDASGAALILGDPTQLDKLSVRWESLTQSHVLAQVSKTARSVTAGNGSEIAYELMQKI